MINSLTLVVISYEKITTRVRSSILKSDISITSIYSSFTLQTGSDQVTGQSRTTIWLAKIRLKCSRWQPDNEVNFFQVCSDD